MKKTSFERLSSFLLGASWAFVLAGSALVFHSFAIFGFVSAVLATFVYVFFALFLVLALDAFVVNRQRLEEAKKQTKLLRDIEKKLSE